VIHPGQLDLLAGLARGHETARGAGALGDQADEDVVGGSARVGRPGDAGLVAWVAVPPTLTRAASGPGDIQAPGNASTELVPGCAEVGRVGGGTRSEEFGEEGVEGAAAEERLERILRREIVHGSRTGHISGTGRADRDAESDVPRSSQVGAAQVGRIT